MQLHQLAGRPQAGHGQRWLRTRRQHHLEGARREAHEPHERLVDGRFFDAPVVVEDEDEVVGQSGEHTGQDAHRIRRQVELAHLRCDGRIGRGKGRAYSRPQHGGSIDRLVDPEPRECARVGCRPVGEEAGLAVAGRRDDEGEGRPPLRQRQRQSFAPQGALGELGRGLTVGRSHGSPANGVYHPRTGIA